MPPIPTQLDIARALGLSKMTVSQALRNDPRISLATRAKVAGLAKSMGYQINAHARTLATQRHKAPQARLPIALLNLWSPPSHWQKLGWSNEVLAGCHQRAEELGYCIDEIALRAPGMTAKRGSQILKSRGIRGVLIAPAPHSHSHLNLEWQHFAAAAMGFTFRRPNLHRAASNLPLCIQLALHHLKHFAYRRIGLLLDKAFVQRMDGTPEAHFLHYQKDIPANERIPILWTTWRSFGQELPSWLKRHRPDVVMTFWGSVFPWLKKAGYSIPGDLGYVHLDWANQMQEQIGIQPAAITLENQVVGARAVDLVVSQLEHHEYGIPASPTVMLVTPRWIAGQTIRNLKHP